MPQELQAMAVQYWSRDFGLYHVTTNCTAIGGSPGDVIRTTRNYIVNYIY